MKWNEAKSHGRAWRASNGTAREVGIGDSWTVLVATGPLPSRCLIRSCKIRGMKNADRGHDSMGALSLSLSLSLIVTPGGPGVLQEKITYHEGQFQVPMLSLLMAEGGTSGRPVRSPEGRLTWRLFIVRRSALRVTGPALRRR